MNLHTLWSHGALTAQQYQQEADTHRLLALAPRRAGGRPVLARSLRGLAQRLAHAADWLEPTHARAVAHDTPNWRGRRAPAGHTY